MPKKRKQPETFDEFLGAEIESRFGKRGISQERAAELLGWSLSSYGRKMRGETSVTSKELVQAAGVLEREPAEIIDQALADFGGIDKLMSEVASTTEDASNVTRIARPDSASDIDAYRNRKELPTAANAFSDEADVPDNE